MSQHKENRKITVLEKDIRELDIDNKLFSGVDEVYHFTGIGDIVPIGIPKSIWMLIWVEQ